ncbi:hypothetical protein F2Q68_00022547 [Brassica cretica]|uniref:Uncharacterized protein n=1 Tax=Brassica cretica TaxID=69181 RepID=A0A8S9G131_BRACR|nr:hypothetical protein F2Q68_00022547 [Brassica cretica]
MHHNTKKGIISNSTPFFPPSLYTQKLIISDVVKHFSAKYGKDFVSAAVGLQSDSGVSRLLVDTLSVKAPDGPTKNKILKEIATEHNVTWEPEYLVEPDPKETVLMSTVEDTERKSHGHDVAPVMVTADKSILSVFVLCCLSRLFMDWV